MRGTQHAPAGTFRFPNVSCSNCGRDFGPGDHGFSHCWQHGPRLAGLDARELGEFIADALDDIQSDVEIYPSDWTRVAERVLGLLATGGSA